MKETIAKELNIKRYPFIIYENGREIYQENKNGWWIKREFNDNGDLIYYITSEGYSLKK